MAELSPAAQAVLKAAEDAYLTNFFEFHNCAKSVAAAALRALAKQREPLIYVVYEDDILAIAAELENR